jgi:hypothetical protein
MPESVNVAGTPLKVCVLLGSAFTGTVSEAIACGMEYPTICDWGTGGVLTGVPPNKTKSGAGAEPVDPGVCPMIGLVAYRRFRTG